jgi:hypothetical protein
MPITRRLTSSKASAKTALPFKKTIGIVTFEDFLRRTNVGSSRIRAHWLLNYWPEAELFTTGRHYNVTIFQKSYWLHYAENYSGLKILDVCDPDFLDWRREVKRMVDCCDAVTTATEALADVLKEYTTRPVVCVPDRLDPSEFAGIRKNHTHEGPAKVVVWYGYSHNFASLDSIVHVLPDLGITDLLVIAEENKPYQLASDLRTKLQLKNFSWSPTTLYDHMLQADIVLNPRIPNGRWKYKSNNKSLIAWAIGMPVAHTTEELAALITQKARIDEADRRLHSLFDEYHVRKSVEQYRGLMRDLEVSAHATSMTA